jgi:hypothetical protein
VDNVEARADFVDSVSETAQGADTTQAGGLFNVAVSESASITDEAFSRFLWELIDDSQVANWQEINTNQTSNWQPVSMT